MKYSNLNSFSRSIAMVIRNCSAEARRNVRPRRSVICQPSIPLSETQKIESIVGLHVGLNHVSWVKLKTDGNEIVQTGITDFPDNFEKMNLSELSFFAFQSFQMLPEADHCILEESMKVYSSAANRQQILFQSSRMQYVAMLVVLLNFNVDNQRRHKALFLKHRLAARLFGLLIGTEIISSAKTMNEILTKNTSPRFTPVKCSDEFKSQYCSRTKIEQEIIGQSVVLALTFVELMIYQNEKCFEFLGLSSIISQIQNFKKNV